MLSTVNCRDFNFLFFPPPKLFIPSSSATLSGSLPSLSLPLAPFNTPFNMFKMTVDDDDDDDDYYGGTGKFISLCSAKKKISSTTF